MLRHDSDLPAQARETDVGDIDAVDENLPGPEFVQSHQQVYERAFSRAIQPGDGQRLPCLDDEAHVVKSRRPPRIGKTDIAKDDLSPHARQVARSRPIGSGRSVSTLCRRCSAPRAICVCP